MEPAQNSHIPRYHNFQGDLTPRVTKVTVRLGGAAASTVSLEVQGHSVNVDLRLDAIGQAAPRADNFAPLRRRHHFRRYPGPSTRRSDAGPAEGGDAVAQR
jgi:hypothetical protein